MNYCATSYRVQGLHDTSFVNIGCDCRCNANRTSEGAELQWIVPNQRWTRTHAPGGGELQLFLALKYTDTLIRKANVFIVINSTHRRQIVLISIVIGGQILLAPQMQAANRSQLAVNTGTLITGALVIYSYCNKYDLCSRELLWYR